MLATNLQYSKQYYSATAGFYQNQFEYRSFALRIANTVKRSVKINCNLNGVSHGLLFRGPQFDNNLHLIDFQLDKFALMVFCQEVQMWQMPRARAQEKINAAIG